jgi:hypothetical protein
VTTTEEHKAGYRAAKYGLGVRNCPHPYNTVKGQDWLEGYLHRKREEKLREFGKRAIIGVPPTDERNHE